MNKKIWILIIFIGCLIAVDQLTKWFFYTLNIASDSSIITPLFNTGISLGMAMPSVISILIAIFSCLLFCFLLHKSYLTRLEVGFLLAGALGNLIDRLTIGGVRDFISIGNFPIFNFADVFLTIGVMLVFIREIFLLTPKEKKL